MDQAHSMILGHSISADRCDNESYKELLLCCPGCWEPVFLKAGAYNKPHFAHFWQGKGMISCSLKSSYKGYSARLSSGFSNITQVQKLEIFQRYLLSMVLAGFDSSLIGISWDSLSSDSDRIKTFQQENILIKKEVDARQSLQDLCQKSRDWLNTYKRNKQYLGTRVSDVCYKKIKKDEGVDIYELCYKQKEIAQGLVLYYLETEAGREHCNQLLYRTIYRLFLCHIFIVTELVIDFRSHLTMQRYKTSFFNFVSKIIHYLILKQDFEIRGNLSFDMQSVFRQLVFDIISIRLDCSSKAISMGTWLPNWRRNSEADTSRKVAVQTITVIGSSY